MVSSKDDYFEAMNSHESQQIPKNGNKATSINGQMVYKWPVHSYQKGRCSKRGIVSVAKFV